MADAEETVEWALAVPLELVIVHAGRGIAQSQLELDKNSISTQVLIDNDEGLVDAGIKAPWYHFAEVTVELKMDLSLQRIVQRQGGKLQAARLKIFSAPMNAAYNNTFSFNASGASTITAKIVPIPSPAA
ncbi:MAG: hypothetical protein WB699_08030 [Bacteroidota bacterium]